MNPARRWATRIAHNLISHIPTYLHCLKVLVLFAVEYNPPCHWGWYFINSFGIDILQTCPVLSAGSFQMHGGSKDELYSVKSWMNGRLSESATTHKSNRAKTSDFWAA